MVMELRKLRNRDLLYFIFLCMLPCSNGTLSSDGVNYEVQALMEFKASLSDPQDVFANWDAYSVDPCNWALVACSSSSLVISLGAPSRSLSGELSPSIGNLSNLQSLLLENNNITGPIPPAVGSLSRLQQLDLSNNLLTGLIPSSLGGLTSIKFMTLGNNSLSGAIPSSLRNLTKLALLDLSYNNLSGPVPIISAKTFNIVGNPICPTGSEPGCSQMHLIPVVMPSNGTQASQASGKFNLVVGLSLGSLCLLALAFGLFLWWWRKSNQQASSGDVEDWHHEEIGLGNLKRFPFRELQIGTENFSNKNLLGKGGYGDVYKGRLQDGTVVAVKRLKDGSAAGGVIQFKTELETISLAVHRNLIRLYGFCITTKERLLVYQYMSNGSVSSRLKEKPVLDWGTRKRIALGAARGLLYLHEQCDPKIIHRDVKAANILLDDYCEAVVGDFGLAKLLNHEESHVTTAVRGTVGHIAPEYLSTGQSSEKTDVFGFGILLLELITGQRALEFGKAANQKGFALDLVMKIHQEKKLDLLVDKNLKNNYDGIEVEEMVQVALLCTQLVPGHRPKMSEIVRMLDGDQLAGRRWASSQSLDSTRSKPYEFSFEQYPDLTEDSSVFAQAIELSGPR